MNKILDMVQKAECTLLGGVLVAVWALPAAWAQRGGNMHAVGSEWLLILAGAAAGCWLYEKLGDLHDSHE